jgi:hypothetical protein
MTNKIDTQEVATAVDMATPSTEPDLVDRMRRMSVGSTESQYSLVSSIPSVQSLDSNGSANGGVSVEPPSIEVLETCLEALTAAAGTLDPIDHRRASIDTACSVTEATKPEPQPANCTSTTPSSSISPYWQQFPGFVPEPTATFKHELARLAKHENWNSNAKRKQQVKALTAEIAHHYGTHMNKLDRWQQLCEDVGVDVIPTSITQCRKVPFERSLQPASTNMTQTVSPVLVNLYNVIDHRRNPDVKIVRFKSYGEFCRYARNGHKFPKECAKQDNIIRVLLKKM